MAIAKIKTKDDIKLVLVMDDGQIEALTKKKIEILEARKRGSSLYPPMMEVKNTAS